MSGATAAGQPRRASILRHASAALGGPSGLIGAIIAAVMIFLAIFAPLVAPYSPVAVNLDHQFAPPGAPYWFGTDQSGRDVLSRVIWGARPSLEVGIVAVIVSFAGGVALGLAAGFYNGGWFEQIVMRCLEVMASIPLLIWAIAIVGILGVEPFHVGPFVFGNQIKVMGLLACFTFPVLLGSPMSRRSRKRGLTLMPPLILDERYLTEKNRVAAAAFAERIRPARLSFE